MAETCRNSVSRGSSTAEWHFRRADETRQSRPSRPSFEESEEEHERTVDLSFCGSFSHLDKENEMGNGKEIDKKGRNSS